ncbi:10815_t:CDS:2 [Dentiscutata erythropus]|uniref:10815_t:CDS:1 n=1 Tax=Dentiscutata erythropus TaxID=1348616 RepID=A0A9N9NBG4_9GLOM|nr:10815_t:CDS:2 [Dentiscutata erythropus]
MTSTSKTKFQKGDDQHTMSFKDIRRKYQRKFKDLQRECVLGFNEFQSQYTIKFEELWDDYSFEFKKLHSEYMRSQEDTPDSAPLRSNMYPLSSSSSGKHQDIYQILTEVPSIMEPAQMSISKEQINQRYDGSEIIKQIDQGNTQMGIPNMRQNINQFLNDSPFGPGITQTLTSETNITSGYNNPQYNSPSVRMTQQLVQETYTTNEQTNQHHDSSKIIKQIDQGNTQMSDPNSRILESDMNEAAYLNQFGANFIYLSSGTSPSYPPSIASLAPYANFFDYSGDDHDQENSTRRQSINMHAANTNNEST